LGKKFLGVDWKEVKWSEGKIETLNVARCRQEMELPGHFGSLAVDGLRAPFGPSHPQGMHWACPFIFANTTDYYFSYLLCNDRPKMDLGS